MARAVRGLFSLAAAAALFVSGCAKGGGAVLVEDSYWSVALRTSRGAETLREDVKRATGIPLDVLEIPPGAPAAELLETYLEERKPAFVIVGAFAAMELQGLAERYPPVRFFCLDAPREIPENTPYVWVRFDPGPALRSAAGAIKKHLESGGGPVRIPAAFLDPVTGGAFAAAAAGEGLLLDAADIPPESTLEDLRAAVREKTAGDPPLAVVFAGPRSAAVLDLLRAGKPIPVVFADGGNFPDRDAPFPAGTVEKDYAAAISAALVSDAPPGGDIEVPMTWDGKLFDKAN